MANKIDPSKKHYFLIAGTIHFTAGEEQEEFAVTLNGTIFADSPVITARHLGKAQQTLQINLARQLGDGWAKVTVKNVILLNIVPLGYQSAKEFTAGMVPPAEGSGPAPVLN